MYDSGIDNVSAPPEIIATCQQTRFHISEDKRSSEISIEQLTLSIQPSGAVNQKDKPAKAKKSKAFAGKTKDIIVNATLKLKANTRYGLLGRNGSGKSTLLRAMATKAIPGLSLATKIALLQQTATEDNGHLTMSDEVSNKSALQYILEGDETRNQIQAELNILTATKSGGIDDKEELAQIIAFRRLQYNRMQRQLVEMQKNAALRSGARGFQARKELTAFEKKVEEAKKRTVIIEEPHDSKELQEELAQASQLVSELQAELDERRLDDLESQALKMLSSLGFSNTMVQTPFSELSGGWQMRCVLASTLIQDSDIMILDEPTNFLDLLGIIWLQKYLVNLQSETDKTVIVVSHDRDFINNVCQEIILIKDQSLVYFDGNLSAYETDLQSRRLNLIRMKEAQDKLIAHMEKTIATNMQAGKKQGDDNKLRQAVSRQKKLEDRMGMQVNAKGGKFKLSRDMAGYHLSKRAAIEIPPEETSASMTLPLAPDLRFPGALVSLEQVTFSYNSKQAPVLRDINLSIHMGSRVGIVGLNGSGKSTLVKLVTELVSPTKGAVSRHPRLKLGYYSQLAIEDLRAAGRANPSMTALSKLVAEVGDELDESDIRGLLASFHLIGNTASHVPVAKLSGGQLVRLALAGIVWKHPHLLVLDEVTTHLDFYTVQALSRALMAFNGALLIVSHDRFFVKSVIEGSAKALRLDEVNDLDSDEELKLEMQRSLYLTKNGKLTPLERGMRDFEDRLESRAAKLLAS